MDAEINPNSHESTPKQKAGFAAGALAAASLIVYGLAQLVTTAAPAIVSSAGSPSTAHAATPAASTPQPQPLSRVEVELIATKTAETVAARLQRDVDERRAHDRELVTERLDRIHETLRRLEQQVTTPQRRRR